MVAANMVGTVLLNKVGLRVGNGRYLRSRLTPLQKEEALSRLGMMSRKQILLAAGSLMVDAPVSEEAIFRLVPSATANALGLKGNIWEVGAGTSAAFASTHGFKNKDGDITLPIPQFTLGMFTWWLQRNRGYTHAVLAHSINNSLPTPWPLIQNAT
jgi:membrane protease YdiL (CAAX protease family)